MQTNKDKVLYLPSTQISCLFMCVEIVLSKQSSVLTLKKQIELNRHVGTS